MQLGKPWRTGVARQSPCGRGFRVGVQECCSQLCRGVMNYVPSAQHPQTFGLAQLFVRLSGSHFCAFAMPYIKRIWLSGDLRSSGLGSSWRRLWSLPELMRRSGTLYRLGARAYACLASSDQCCSGARIASPLLVDVGRSISVAPAPADSVPLHPTSHPR